MIEFPFDNARLSLLLDYYGELLKERQKDMCDLYFEDNLSLVEIADELGISKQAVSESIRKTLLQLENYEEKLQLLKKHNKYQHLLIRCRNLMENRRTGELYTLIKELDI